MWPAENAYGQRKRLEFCAAVIERVRPARVLDVGCGTGNNLTRPLALRFPEVRFLGIDSDARSIEYARSAGPLANLEYGGDDALARADAVDLVIASEVLEHVEDPLAFLTSLRGRLAAGGRMIVTLPNGRGPFEFASLVEVLLRLSGLFDVLRRLKRSVAGGGSPESRDTLAISPHLHFFSHHALQNLFASAGLAPERYRARTFLCGFGFDYLIRGPAAVRWNAAAADRLPPAMVSAWMFELLPAPARAARSYRPGPFARWRRRLNERCWGGDPASDPYR